MNPLNLLFPKRCVGCNKFGSYFCKDCISEIKQTDLVCPFCERISIGGLTHPHCQRRYGLDGLWSLGIYQDPLKKAIQKIKYKWVKELAEDLINLLIEYWAKFQPILLDQIKKSKGKDWIVTSIPLHWSRKNWRGFNQAELLAKLLAKKLGLKYQELLKRKINTKTQVGLDLYSRRKNIKGAFVFSPNSSLISHNILLVDDVWTTGSTLKECCFVLKKAGAKIVWALTLAR